MADSAAPGRSRLDLRVEEFVRAAELAGFLFDTGGADQRLEIFPRHDDRIIIRQVIDRLTLLREIPATSLSERGGERLFLVRADQLHRAMKGAQQRLDFRGIALHLAPARGENAERKLGDDFHHVENNREPLRLEDDALRRREWRR